MFISETPSEILSLKLRNEVPLGEVALPGSWYSEDELEAMEVRSASVGCVALSLGLFGLTVHLRSVAAQGGLGQRHALLSG